MTPKYAIQTSKYWGFLMIDINSKVISSLEKKSRQIRLETARICYQVGPERKAHPGPALSITDIIVALYYHVMEINPQKPNWSDRDRFILSKGHGCVSLYAVLADIGYFPKKELYTLRRLGSILQGHPCMGKTPGIDMTAGSLGNGLGAGVGMAIGAKLDNKNNTVFVLIGDGELNEGIVWEAAETASKYDLDNIVAIVDVNRFQSCGPCDVIMPSEDIKAKWCAFGWDAEQIDGHDMSQILYSLNLAKYKKMGYPKVVIANTVKGKGISFMENNNSWHQRALTKDEWLIAKEELGENKNDIPK